MTDKNFQHIKDLIITSFTSNFTHEKANELYESMLVLVEKNISILNKSSTKYRGFIHKGFKFPPHRIVDYLELHADLHEKADVLIEQWNSQIKLQKNIKHYITAILDFCTRIQHIGYLLPNKYHKYLPNDVFDYGIQNPNLDDFSKEDFKNRTQKAELKIKVQGVVNILKGY